MTIITLRRRERIVQPQDAAQVIDRRVTRAILPQALGVVDLANGGGITVSGSGFSRAANGQGYGLRNNSLTRANYVNVTKRTEESTSITIVWTGVVHQTGGSTYPFFRSNQTIIYATAATNAMWGCRFGAAVNANSTTPIKLGVPTTYVFTQTGSVGSLFVDGVAVLLNVSGGSSGLAASHGIDGNLAFNQSNDITTNAFFILDKGVSIGEARELSLNPWQLFKPVERRIWVPVSGGPVTHSLSASALAQAAATAALDAQAGGTTVDLGATGSAQASAAASLLKGVSLASAGLAVATGGASVAHVVPLQASAVAVAQAGAGLALGVTLSAAGLAQAAAAAGMAHGVPLAAAGAGQASGSAALSTSSGLELAAGAQAQASGGAVLSLVVNLSAAGVAQALATAGLAHGVLLAAAGLAQAGGSAALQVGAPLDLAAAGVAQATAGASLWVDVPLSAAALAQAAAAGSLQLSVPLGAAALAQAGGSAVLAGAVTLAAGGQAVATGGATLQVMGPMSQYERGMLAAAEPRTWRAPRTNRAWRVKPEHRAWRAS